MATKFKTRINAKPSKGEEQIDKVSLTVPDRVPSMEKILRNYQKGLPLKWNAAPPVYNPDFEYHDFNRYDLAEVDEIKNQITEKIQKLKSDEKAINRKKAELGSAVNALKAKQSNPDT